MKFALVNLKVYQVQRSVTSPPKLIRAFSGHSTYSPINQHTNWYIPWSHSRLLRPTQFNLKFWEPFLDRQTPLLDCGKSDQYSISPLYAW